MRILMISDVYFPRVNGVSTSIKLFRKALMEAGHEVVLIAPEYADTTEDEKDIIRISSREVIVDPEDRMMRIGQIKRMTKTLKLRQFDIVHIHTPFVAHYAGLHIAKAMNIPVVTTYHTFFEEYLFNYIKWLPKKMLRFAARHFSRAQCADVHTVLVPSTAMHEVLQQYGVKTPMRVLPTGLDVEEFDIGLAEEFRQRNPIEENRPTMLYVGRVAFEKNIDFLLRMTGELVKTVPDVLFLIAGEGPATEILNKRIQALNLEKNVSFIGYLERDGELQSCYKAADVFVFASRTETQGLVLLESMLCYTPVVSTAVMGTRDVMGQGEGGLIAEEQEQQFAEKVKALLTDHVLKTKKTRQARAYAETWSDKSQAKKLTDIYMELILTWV